MSDSKDTLLERIREVLGHVPVDMERTLRLLSHPDVITATNAYFGPLDRSFMCTAYEMPWNCLREAEAKYMNIRYGWTGGAGLMDESWCENCRKRVIGELPRDDEEDTTWLTTLKGERP